jgi:hypothetical protein
VVRHLRQDKATLVVMVRVLLLVGQVVAVVLVVLVLLARLVSVVLVVQVLVVQ